MHILPRATIVACVATLSLGSPAATAIPAPDASPVVRSAHFSPDTPSVDVYLTSFAGGTTTLALSNVGYGDVSDYQRIAPGLYTVGMRPAGADPTTPVAVSWTLDAKPGEAFTACAIGMKSALQGKVLTDDLTAPPPGQARVRIIQAASRAPKADVGADNGPRISSGVPFAATTGYTSVPAGTWPITARSVEDPTVSATKDVTLTAGQISTVIVLDAPQGGIALRFLSDGVGSADMPIGPVAAGGGGAARHPGPSDWLLDVGIVITAVAFALAIPVLGGAMRRTG